MVIFARHTESWTFRMIRPYQFPNNCPWCLGTYESCDYRGRPVLPWTEMICAFSCWLQLCNRWLMSLCGLSFQESDSRPQFLNDRFSIIIIVDMRGSFIVVVSMWDSSGVVVIHYLFVELYGKLDLKLGCFLRYLLLIINYETFKVKNWHLSCKIASVRVHMADIIVPLRPRGP